MASSQNIYFDTSVWNHLTDAPDRDRLIHVLKRRRQIPRPSVISVGEILLTPDLDKRKWLCHTVRALNGTRQVLERPFDIAKAAASAYLNGNKTLRITESGPARSFYDALADPENAPVQQVEAWIDNMNSKMEKFIQGIRPPSKDTTTNYLKPDVLVRDDFLSCLGKFPSAQELGLTVHLLRELVDSSDIWRSLAATLAYIIQLSTTHAPKRRRTNGKGAKRPDAADIWQTVYLGCVQVFVTGDAWLLEAATEVSRLLKYQRCTIHSSDFLDAVRRFASGTPSSKGICSICGIATGQAKGRHAVFARAS